MTGKNRWRHISPTKHPSPPSIVGDARTAFGLGMTEARSPSPTPSFIPLAFPPLHGIGLIAKKPPEMHEFEISEKGIRIGQAFHPYDSIISFWVDEELPQPLLLVDTTTVMSPNLIIPIGENHPDEIREALRPHARETLMKEPLAHKILEFFGF